MSAVTLMGDSAEDDATAGTQPWGTLLARNLVREIGIIEKQSSALFLGKAALTRVEGNVMFNGPRAFIKCVAARSALGARRAARSPGFKTLAARSGLAPRGPRP